uniref:Uncharacterized protein n=1 Tax=Anguilla anguilla TaxID=7936 RepID=A0A0E9UEK8_ANGAN
MQRNHSVSTAAKSFG